MAETSIVSSVASYGWVNRRYSKPSLLALLEEVNGGSPRARPRFRSRIAMSAAVLPGLTAFDDANRLQLRLGLQEIPRPGQVFRPDRDNDFIN